jgi:hypothetical protein
MACRRLKIPLAIAASLLLSAPWIAEAQKPHPAPYPPLPPGVANHKLDNASGGMTAVSSFQGKVVMLLIIGKSEKDEGGKLSGDINFAMAKQPDFARVSIANLPGYPSPLHGYILRRVGDSYRTGVKETEDRFKQHGLTCLPRHRDTVLVDFSGDVAKKLGVEGQTDDTYQAYVLDRQQHIVLHLTEGQNHNSEARTRELITAAIRRELARKR